MSSFSRLAATAAAMLTVMTAANAAVVNVETDTQAVPVGGTFDIRVTFDAETETETLFDAAFDLSFDDELFAFVGASFIDPISGDNELEAVEDGVFDAELTAEGILSVTAGSFDFLDDLAVAQADSFTIVTLTFQNLMTGEGTFALTDFASFLVAADLFDDFGFEADIGTTSVSVSAVPLPGAAIFLLTGLAGIAARRRFA